MRYGTSLDLLNHPIQQHLAQSPTDGKQSISVLMLLSASEITISPSPCRKVIENNLINKFPLHLSRSRNRIYLYFRKCLQFTKSIYIVKYFSIFCFKCYLFLDLRGKSLFGFIDCLWEQQETERSTSLIQKWPAESWSERSTRMAN